MKRLALLVSAVVVATGCIGAGTETGNPPRYADVELALAAPDVAPARNGLTADPLTGARITEAWISVERVKFVEAERCDTAGETENHFERPIVADLAAAPVARVIEGLPVTAYCQVLVRLGRADAADGVPAELVGHSVLLRGTRADGTPFQLRSRRQPDADVRNDAAPFPLEEGLNALLLALDAKAWLAAVDLDAAVVEGGAITIEDDRNEDLLDAFEGSMARQLSLHEDADGDHDLDDDEAEPIADSF